MTRSLFTSNPATCRIKVSNIGKYNHPIFLSGKEIINVRKPASAPYTRGSNFYLGNVHRKISSQENLFFEWIF